MKTAIVGYGNMGKEIEKILFSRNHTVTVRIDPSGSGDALCVTADVLKGSDVVIEFALPDAVLKNAGEYASAGIPAVVGTTGWEADRNKVAEIIKSNNSAYLWAANFSIGAHLFFNLIEKAASLINNVPEYDIMVNEFHHSRKKDSPSGTALTVGDIILKANNTKKTIITDRLDREIKKEELHIGSVRGGSIPGIHSVILDSIADTIEIKHTARNREGFALGAVMAAEWIIGKRGFFQVDDFLKDILSIGGKK